MNTENPIQNPEEASHHDETSALKYLKTSRVILPVLIGLGVVIWMFTRQLDIDMVRKFDFNLHTFFWVGMAAFMYVLRHMFYSMRLRIVTDYAFSWLKAMQLIVIWEFSTAVSPTSVGGAGVAFFLLSKEKLSGAKTISVVLYTMVIDTIFFVSALIFLYITIGPVMIRPGMKAFSDIDGYGITFITVLLFMVTYGIVFFYGLFINPKAIKRFLLLLSKTKILKRFRTSLRNTAYDVMTTSEAIRNKPFRFHISAFLCTMGAWTVRFLAINCLIIAFVPDTHRLISDHFTIFARGMAMHAIEAFSPTPGAAGVAEFLFSGFFSDFVPVGMSVIIVMLWRLFGYYSYLTAGVIVIPVWLKNIMNKKNQTTA